MEEKLALQAQLAKLNEQFAVELGNGTASTKKDSTIIETLSKIDKNIPSDQLGIFGLFHGIDQSESDVLHSLDHSKEAYMLRASKAGWLGTKGNKERGIPAGMPLKLENYEAYNKVQIVILILGQGLRTKELARQWIREHRAKKEKLRQLVAELPTIMELKERAPKQQAIFELMEEVYTEQFDWDNIPIDMDWIQKNSPTLWHIAQRAMILFLGRTFSLEELAFQMEAVAGVVHPVAGFEPQTQGGTSTKMKKALEALQFIAEEDE